MPKVSVVVPNYNHKRYLPARLESIFAQTFGDYEVILLDDCSTDGSAELLESYAGHAKVAEIVLGQSNVGPFAQWRRGVQKATGEYAWIAESDDLAQPNFLEQMVAVLDTHPAVGIAYCQSQVIDEHGHTLFDNRRWTNDMKPDLWGAPFQAAGARCLLDFFVFKNVIPNASAVLFRTDLFQLVSSEVAQFRYAGDWLAWTQILRTCELYFTPLPLNSFRQHAESTRVGRRFEQSARYLDEVYRIVSGIARDPGLGEARRTDAYDRLAVKAYREIGVRNLLSARGVGLVHQLASYDAGLPQRLLTLALRGAKRRLLDP